MKKTMMHEVHRPSVNLAPCIQSIMDIGGKILAIKHLNQKSLWARTIVIYEADEPSTYEELT